MKRYLTLIGLAVAFFGQPAFAQVDFTLNAPDTLTGNTCGATNDCALSPSEDHIYQVVIPCSGDWKFSLCNSTYNTSMFLTTSICGGTTLASNDDFCGQQSEFVVNLTAGTYYLAVEGASGGDCGAYTIEVSDAQAPVINNCQSNVTLNNDNNVCGAVYNYSAPTATDNCGLASFTSNHNSGETFPVGITTITYTAVDNAGNTSTCSFDVTVNDVQPPVFTNCPNNIIMNNDPGMCEAVVTWNAPIVTDNCGVNTVTTTNSPGGSFPVGVTTVTYTATDNSGNASTCTFTVTILDVESPSISCPGPISVSNDPGDCGAIVTYNVTADDNCPSYNLGLTSGLGSGSFFPVGTTTESYTVTDAAGNVSSCSFTVTVTDDELPVFNCPSDMLVCGDSSVVTFTAPSVTDNCTGVVVSQIGGPASGSQFPIGPTTITYGAIDNAGNTTTCSFDVVVYNSPMADFSHSPACEGEAILFDENSVVPIDSISSFQWNMGDGSGVIVIRNPLHQFSDTGMYDVSLIVTTDQGCADTATKTVHVTPVPVADFTTANGCQGDTVSFTNASTIDAGNLNYMWTFGDGANSTDIDPGHVYANPGPYDVQLQVTSDAGCTDETMISVTVYSNPSGSFNSQNILCHGETTGWINVLAGNGIPPYEFSLDSGMTNQNNGSFTGLDAGSYDVLISDDNGCEAYVNINITEPDTLVAQINTLIDVACNGDATGSINVGITGGASPYLYSIDGSAWQINPAFNNLGAGPYLVEVQDNNGCQDTVNVMITEPPVLDAQIVDQQDVMCFGDLTGELMLGASGGVAPYEYSVNGGTDFQENDNFLNLGAGQYNLVVKDDNGCWTMLSTNITQPSELLIETEVEPVGCFGEANGSIQILAAGSVGNYQYSIDGGQNYSAMSSYNDLVAGEYLVSVIDGNGCTSSEGATVSGPTGPLNTLAAVSDALCFGDSSGVITVNTTGGTELYEYSLNGGPWQLGHVFNGLPLGNYIIWTQDDHGCTDADTVFVGQPGTLPTFDLLIVEDVTCYNSNNGTITVQAGGGTPSYTYSLNGGAFQASTVFNGLGEGTYSIDIMDANGCMIEDSVDILQPDTALYVELSGSSSPVCEGDTTGAFTLAANGGTAPYTYNLNGNIQPNGTFGNLEHGVYTVLVKDNNNCSATYQYFLEADNLLPDADFDYQVAGSSVAFTNLSTDGVAYNWNFGDTTSSGIENPTHQYNTPGEYQVTLVATNGCGSDTIVTTISTYNTGINDVASANMLVYPNPSDGNFVVEILGEGLSQGNTDINVYSIEGKLVERSTLKTGVSRIIFKSFAPGAYLVEMLNGDNVVRKKLIIK